MGPINLLPYDGQLFYYPDFYPQAEATLLYQELLNNIPWQHDEVIIFGKKIITKRKMAWYAAPGLDYTYSGSTKTALPFTQALLQIKTEVEKVSGAEFNSCLLNFYHDGQEAMGWHSDNENTLEKNGIIAAVSFGAERRFVFRHRGTKEKKEILLEKGSLVLMSGIIQEQWQHAIPKMATVKTPRISLTFRQMKAN